MQLDIKPQNASLIFSVYFLSREYSASETWRRKITKQKKRFASRISTTVVNEEFGGIEQCAMIGGISEY